MINVERTKVKIIKLLICQLRNDGEVQGTIISPSFAIYAHPVSLSPSKASHLYSGDAQFISRPKHKLYCFPSFLQISGSQTIFHLRTPSCHLRTPFFTFVPLFSLSYPFFHLRTPFFTCVHFFHLRNPLFTCVPLFSLSYPFFHLHTPFSLAYPFFHLRTPFFTCVPLFSLAYPFLQLRTPFFSCVPLFSVAYPFFT